jgi:hypothetical protein
VIDHDGTVRTYSKDGRIIRHPWLRRHILLGWSLFDSQILDIAATKDNVLIYVVGRRNFVIRISASTFCTEGNNLFKGNS